MKRTIAPCRTMLTLVAAMLTAVFPHRAVAGMTLTYTANGQFTDSTGTRPWPTQLIPTSDADKYVCVYVVEPDSTTGVISSGTITPVLTWDGAGGKLNNLSVVYSVSAGAYPYDITRSDNVTDSFNDPELRAFGYPLGQIDSTRLLTPKPSLAGMQANVPFPLPAVSISGHTYVTPGAPATSRVVLWFRCSMIDISINGESTDEATGSPPPYFSGTNCRVRGSATRPYFTVGGGPKNLTHAWLLVNNEVVNEWPNPNPPPTPPGQFPPSRDPQPSVDLSATFDSTHFADGSDITVTYRVVDDHQTEHEISTTATAKNRALLLGNSSDENLAEVVPGILESLGGSASQMNHSVMPSMTDGKTAILGRLPVYTAFFIDTHGSETLFADCTMNLTIYGPSYYVSYPEIQVSVASKTADQPQYNFVQIQACESAGVTTGGVRTDIANAFGIAYGDVDRAFLGWHHEMAIELGNPEWVKRLWGYLAKGEPALLAVMHSDLEGWPQGEYVRGDPSSYGPVDAILIGDHRTKLHGVYGLDGLAWSRPLEEGM